MCVCWGVDLAVLGLLGGFWALFRVFSGDLQAMLLSELFAP